MVSNVVDRLKEQEGYRQFPYQCTEGKWTVGYGRNLESTGIGPDEATYMLMKDVERCRKSLTDNLSFFGQLTRGRKDALIMMAFQIGIVGLLKFKNMIKHLSTCDYDDAADEALNSKWARQTPERAKEVAKMIKTGFYEYP